MLSDHESYARNWEAEATHLADLGMYKALVAITPKEDTLEVGIGTGVTTAELSRERRVLALECNPHLAASAAARLNDAGRDVTILLDDALNPSSATREAISRFAPRGVVGWFVGGSAVDQLRHVDNSLAAEDWALHYRELMEDALVTGALCPTSVQWVHFAARGKTDPSIPVEEVKALHASDYNREVFGPNGFEIVDIQIFEWNRQGSKFGYVDVRRDDVPSNPVNVVVSMLARRSLAVVS